MDWAEFIAECIPEPVTVQLEPYQGTSGYGQPVYGPPADLAPCVVEDTRRLVRVQTQDAAGAEQVSSTTVYGPLATVPAGSRITIPGRPAARVLAVARNEDHGLGLPSHLELSLE
ncbi:hypothetical protein ACGFI9_37220 [Micromonospora sp. NPDC048930]|uniref:hypothetical protein n=1 Tax=Micromonospora sp. NPDC048930 TaxID=3364261 RepID=UPI00372041E4